MNVSRVIEKRAKDFMTQLDIVGDFDFTVEEGTKLLDEYLVEIKVDSDRYAFLTIISNRVDANLKKHTPCPEPRCTAPDTAEGFLYNLNNRKYEISRYENNLSMEESLIINSYLDDLSDRIDNQVDAEGEMLELIQILKQEIDELRQDLNSLTKRQASKQFRGTIYETAKVLVKIGLAEEAVKKIINDGLEEPISIFNNESLELISGVLL